GSSRFWWGFCSCWRGRMTGRMLTEAIRMLRNTLQRLRPGVDRRRRSASDEPTVLLPVRHSEPEHVLEALLVDASVPGDQPAPEPVSLRHPHDLLLDAVRARSRSRHAPGRSLVHSRARG